uniref:Glycoprotein IX (platelet) n=1 Tax=Kryptolebias marmoratus TaxID=37003 RepID=A0A3Q3B3J3_KRYMA
CKTSTLLFPSPRMLLSGLTVAVLLLTSTGPAGLRANCSSSDLAELPGLPPETTELLTQNNRLTSVPPGLFDPLPRLQVVSLAPNPFRCDCSIQYLRNWLLKNSAVVPAEPLCSSPGPLAQKAISELTDDSFSHCALPLARRILASSCACAASAGAAGVTLLCLVLLLLWSLSLARRSTITLDLGERASGFEAVPLRSPRPEHRRRRRLAEDSDPAAWPESSERPLVNMDLLPQVLDVLHKKHNIKIKAP